MYTSLVLFYQNTVIIILVGFQRNVAHITSSLFLSKSGTKLDKGEVVDGALLDDLPFKNS